MTLSFLIADVTYATIKEQILLLEILEFPLSGEFIFFSFFCCCLFHVLWFLNHFYLTEKKEILDTIY